MSGKPLVRVVTAAWGDKYVGDLLTLTMPALLAPGNLPALVEHFDCTFVLVTEARQFDRISSSSSWRQLDRLCATELLPLDDLIAWKNHYGLSLTFALYRGFVSLGKRMTDIHLVFINSDFILADGSYRTLGTRILAGEKLIQAPSYCVIEHEVSPLLSTRLDSQNGVLRLSPREMASQILAHRHPTIRAKTVNQRLFSMRRHEQFYWQADDHTLLGRQLPISLVCMKPERVVTDLQTFWDYGVVTEFCPSTKPCILSDSDDFLMMELREASRFREMFRLGGMSVSEIADDLSSFTTKDHRESGRFTLVLHDRGLPATLHTAKSQLDDFVDQIYGHMSVKPVDHRNHPYWLLSYPVFEQKRAEYLSQRNSGQSAGMLEPSSLELRKEDHPSRWPFVDSIRDLARGCYEFVYGRVPVVKSTHPFHAILKRVISVVATALTDPGRRVLLVAGQPGLVSQFAQLYEKGNIVSNGQKALWPECPLNWLTFEETEFDMAARLNSEGKGIFDLCVCEVDLTDLLRLKEILPRVIPLMRSKGVIVVFHFNKLMRDLRPFEIKLIYDSTAAIGQSKIHFAGSIWTKWALILYDKGHYLRERYTWGGTVAHLLLSLFATPLSLIGNWLSERKEQQFLSKVCLSLTMEYRLF